MEVIRIEIKEKLKKIRDKLAKLKKVREIKKVIKQKKINELSNEQKKMIIEYWKKFYPEITVEWHQYYSSFGKFDVKYIPEDYFYHVFMPKVNDFRLAFAYEDKNMYDRIYNKILDKPFNLLRNINGNFYNNEYKILSFKEVDDLLKKTEGNFIIKPTIDSCGGNGVIKVKINQGNFYLKEKLIDKLDLLKKYQKNYLIQKEIKQSEFLNKIYPKSLNTIRIMTYQDEGKIHIIAAVLRIGSGGGEVDNFSAGGFAVGINITTGKLNSFGTNKNGEIYEEVHPETKQKFSNKKIPNWENILVIVKEWSNDIPNYFRICSWDIALNEFNNPIFIEVNLRYPELGFHQINTGSLFGEKTDYFLNKMINL